MEPGQPARVRAPAPCSTYSSTRLEGERSAYGMSGLAPAQGRPEASAQLIGASEHARQVIGTTRWPGRDAMDDAQSAAVTATLDPETFAAAHAEGARMPLPDALAYRLAATILDTPRP